MSGHGGAVLNLIASPTFPASHHDLTKWSVSGQAALHQGKGRQLIGSKRRVGIFKHQAACSSATARPPW
jgi:hypothetical protein